MRHRGFTLIDLMITLAVAAIVLTAGVPALGKFVAAQRIATNSNLLVTDLHFARTQAITRFQEIGVCPSTDGRNCTGGTHWENGWMVFVKRHDDWKPESDADILRVSEPRASVRITSTPGRIRTKFFPDGQSRGFNLSITVCDPARPERARRVIVWQTGRVRTQAKRLFACP